MKYRVIRFYGGAQVGSIIEPDHGVAQALLARKVIEPIESKAVPASAENKLMKHGAKHRTK